MKFSRKLKSMDHSPIRKFYKYAEDAKNKGKKVYHLNIGQPDIKTPDVFINAIKNFADEIVAYMPSQGIPELITQIRKYYERHDVFFDDENIIITNGGSEALTFTLLSITNEGDEIIVPEPYYSNYNIFIKGTGAKIVPITTRAENGFHFAREEEIENRITKRTKAILLTNPGNPTGTVLTLKEMRMIADVAKKHNIFIISDEVYREFVYNGTPVTSFGQLPDVTDRVILIDSVSKRFSACGARIGALLTKNEELLDHVLKLCQGRLSCSTLDMVGAAELYKLPHTYFNDIKKEYQKRRDIVYDILSPIEGVVCRKPSGAFYLTVKLPVDNAEEFLVWMLTSFDIDNETVMFAPIEGFYETPGLGKDEIRLAYVLNEKDLTKAMCILKAGLEKYRLLTCDDWDKKTEK
ncbi:MAG: pyridoxal phosphate-dependent aminotransferase [Clostridia bacterium]|nr:pyridoxal phosphate-dependent aminotransferase [Clostridia bacterium]